MSRFPAVSVPMRKPRNALVPLARGRRAGAHGPTAGARRQEARRALQREIAHTLASP